MQCDQVVKRLSAWADLETAQEEKKEIARHLSICADCRARALAYEKLALALDDLALVRAPRGFSKKVCTAARAGAQPMDINQWWQHLSLTWRGMVCTMAMAGLLFGAVLGTSLQADQDDTDTTDLLTYLSMPDDGGYY